VLRSQFKEPLFVNELYHLIKISRSSVSKSPIINERKLEKKKKWKCKKRRKEKEKRKKKEKKKRRKENKRKKKRKRKKKKNIVKLETEDNKGKRSYRKTWLTLVSPYFF